MRTTLNIAIRRLLLALGVKPEKADRCRDIVLALVVFFGIILTLVPIGCLLAGQPVAGADLRKGVEGLLIVFLFSSISPNWGDVLAAALALAAFRGGIGFLATRDPRMLFLSLGLLVLAAVFHRLRPGTYG
jgi:hypothetical protein